MQLSDKDILLLFQQDKSEAFRLLLSKYQKPIYHLIRRMVIDHEDANDLIQDVFIKVWNKLDKFRGESKLFTWLYRIAVNETLNFINKKKRRAIISFQENEHKLSSKIDNSNEFSGDEIQKKLQKALLKLPNKQRLVFNMKYFEELTYHQISDITGTSIGALKANYHHAVQKIEYMILNEY
ncbi:MAG: sigma-70 family RNA polymerase sigma factor [Bacteroidetes bacterium]|nr:sigma-70 family RNA polymerase sigma factor [Bacteroidota bacterium]